LTVVALAVEDLLAPNWLLPSLPIFPRAIAHAVEICLDHEDEELKDANQKLNCSETTATATFCCGSELLALAVRWDQAGFVNTCYNGTADPHRGTCVGINCTEWCPTVVGCSGSGALNVSRGEVKANRATAKRLANRPPAAVTAVSAKQRAMEAAVFGAGTSTNTSLSARRRRALRLQQPVVDEQHHPDSRVKKRTFSNHTRFVFVAGLEGTGHHGAATVFSGCQRVKKCVCDKDISAILYRHGGSPQGVFSSGFVMTSPRPHPILTIRWRIARVATAKSSTIVL
jgi:hypothetical protein